ncbi:glycosyltransferase family 39 protein [Mesorhizobium sp. M7A.F.Ca.MR.362.00.0.0]|uniref:glycosyltransferase family 39 protein n=1 Tax=Mesorhizobium sp. M7A.F.Ca.MR.362.00.0.0 TaxID=2496779 RepID=UPI000FD39022|nr:glycosyltransferase family 39 protein [Mesorhizobium sp. M7A.F.Ca.MR.362.00.0.0]RUU82521.1 phospholipid carrier-dependent glycosyltransferase [Mesorhizobium sp. M7A.F.Ca.MR.362.00.0.0]RWN93923.1 MAG: phospholipid carrier-dependent glycosyltransferase [Mesorhizobium sp.]
MLRIKSDWPILALALLFTAKAFFLAFWVTPLWDIPDEIGHYAYTEDIASGRGFPLLGTANISAEINTNVTGVPSPSSDNWIAQHPPIYYLVAAIPLKITTILSDNQDLRFRSPRIVAALAGGLVLIVLYQTLLFLSVDRRTATAVAAATGFVPMFSHLASGTNHDVPLFLFCALVAKYFSRYIVDRQISDAYLCAFWLAVAASTKMTALVLLAPIVAILVFEIDGNLGRIFNRAVILTLIAISLPSIWLARNIWYFGDPFTTSVDLSAAPGQSTTSLSFFEFMRTYPAIEHFVVNFFGLFGWIGTGKGAVSWFQINGLPLTAYSVIFCGFSIIVAVGATLSLAQRPMPALPAPGPVINYFWKFYDSLAPTSRIAYSALILIGAAVAAAVVLVLTQSPNTSYVIAIGAMALMYAAVISLFTIVSGRQPNDVRLFSYCVLTAGFFAIVLVEQIYSLSNALGQLRASHGRYMYPVIPFLVLAFGMLTKRSRALGAVSILVVLIMAYFEIETFIVQVVPFYE